VISPTLIAITGQPFPTARAGVESGCGAAGGAERREAALPAQEGRPLGVSGNLARYFAVARTEMRRFFALHSSVSLAGQTG